MDHFGAQNISNTAWALARVAIVDAQLMEAIAKIATRKIVEWDTQELVN
eukprot:CAMPEP_0197697894 /NCGR_PEP_ID=MMETSP1338-20131121/118586_1 /TAXON_ID=43686 ORGANISM="Pelagodinium beii, Strain RCC1491" /NCGR_SAMPLE_ID=MMETSP1338 /ASSEMBLY_ACC=CAM_ASM_000754 /LENGTH=48 /DNA_ID= /DNA_START= /DNA_END= /DNA_ORIENTATION=